MSYREMSFKISSHLLLLYFSEHLIGFGFGSTESSFLRY